ncbi:hypothetical protein, partial [Corynebacterium belfantii]|uniref:hypothetical protein n=1 Tax=Corynebacterium belfantii TaxID=2014537 RepID=UPI001A7EAF31
LLNTNTILNQTNRSILGFLIKNLWHNPNSPILSNGRKPRPFHLPHMLLLPCRQLRLLAPQLAFLLRNRQRRDKPHHWTR